MPQKIEEVAKYLIKEYNALMGMAYSRLSICYENVWALLWASGGKTISFPSPGRNAFQLIYREIKCGEIIFGGV